jgi:hypothetical protein
LGIGYQDKKWKFVIYTKMSLKIRAVYGSDHKPLQHPNENSHIIVQQKSKVKKTSNFTICSQGENYKTYLENVTSSSIVSVNLSHVGWA